MNFLCYKAMEAFKKDAERQRTGKLQTVKTNDKKSK
ncbi:hypothetical protein CYOC110262_20880 [Cytobacillus oceanisediminis]